MKNKISLFAVLLFSCSVIATPLNRIPLGLVSKMGLLLRSGVGAGIGGAIAVAISHKLGIDFAHLAQHPEILTTLSTIPATGAWWLGRRYYKTSKEYKFNETIKNLDSNEGTKQLVRIVEGTDEEILPGIDNLYLRKTHPRVTAFNNLVAALDETDEASKVIRQIQRGNFIRRRLSNECEVNLNILQSRRDNIKRGIGQIKKDPDWIKRVGSYQKKKAAERVQEAVNQATEASKNSLDAAKKASVSAKLSLVSAIGSWFRKK